MPSLFSSDIQKLNTLYNRMQFSFVFLYGRYHTGKTRLVREFCQNKRTFFFSAREAVGERQLFAFWQETIRCLRPAKKPPHFPDWEHAFAYIADLSFSHRLVLVLDEFQYLYRGCPDFAAAFDRAIRHDFAAGKVFLIVTTSSVGFAEELMQEPLKPPFDAITARARLTCVPFYTCEPYLAGYPAGDQLLLYGVTGGMPSALERLDPAHTARENILTLFFRGDSPLFTEPMIHLHQELREISTYNLLLEIIASGQTRLADIAALACIGTNKCAKYLGVLLSLGLLKKEIPAAGEVQKKVRYVFTDHMLRFWYRFVYPNISGIVFGDGREIFEQQVLPALDEYLLPVFEDVCAEYLERLADTGQTPFVYRHTGSWWSGGTKREPFFRIPLVAMDEKHTVLGICHCGGAPADLSDLESLDRPLEPFGNLQRYRCIFSTSGFSDRLRAAALQTDKVWLIDLEDITAL